MIFFYLDWSFIGFILLVCLILGVEVACGLINTIGWPLLIIGIIGLIVMIPINFLLEYSSNNSKIQGTINGIFRGLGRFLSGFVELTFLIVTMTEFTKHAGDYSNFFGRIGAVVDLISCLMIFIIYTFIEYYILFNFVYEENGFLVGILSLLSFFIFSFLFMQPYSDTVYDTFDSHSWIADIATLSFINSEKDFSNKEKEIIESIMNSIGKASPSDTLDNSNMKYILPQSSTKLLNSQDIASLSLKELNYARNEIFARHGRMFKSQELQNYFNSQSWYTPLYSPDTFDDSVLSDVENQNIQILLNAEHAINPNGYSLS